MIRMGNNFQVIRSWEKPLCGRVGELHDLNDVIRTPTVIPTTNMAKYMAEVKPNICNNNELIQYKLGIVPIGINRDDLENITTDFREELSDKVKATQTKLKIVHIIFNSDVRQTDLTKTRIEDLLEVQRGLGLLRATIPHSKSFSRNFLNRSLKIGFDWVEKADSEMEIIGIGYTVGDIDVLSKNKNRLDGFGVGLNFQQTCKPILNKIMTSLKPLKPEKPIITLSTPFAVKDSGYRATFGAGLSIYGVDIISGLEMVFNTGGFAPPEIGNVKLLLHNSRMVKIKELDTNLQLTDTLTLADLIEDEEMAYKNVKVFNFMALDKEANSINSFKTENDWSNHISSRSGLQSLIGTSASLDNFN